MKEPASLDLFPDDVCPFPSEFLRVRIGRDNFFYHLRRLQNRRSRSFPSALAAARFQLYLLGDLGGVW